MAIFNWKVNKTNDDSQYHFNFRDYLISNGWEKKGANYFIKGYKSIKFVSNNSIMIALNNNKKVKYKHIVTCKVPDDFDKAETLTELTYLK